MVITKQFGMGEYKKISAHFHTVIASFSVLKVFVGIIFQTASLTNIRVYFGMLGIVYEKVVLHNKVVNKNELDIYYYNTLFLMDPSN